MRKIIFPQFPTKVQTTKGRRKVYYKQGETIPLKYRNQYYRFKDNRLWSSITEDYVVKNAKSVDKPRYQPLSYNKVGTRQKMTVLKLLKEYMIKYLPKKAFKTPVMIECDVYDMPLPLTKDLDNMHIYYKAFLDLLTEQKLLKDDSKQFVTQAGGFTYYPVGTIKERKLVFKLTEDVREEINSHMMYQKEEPVLTTAHKSFGFYFQEDNSLPAGEIVVSEGKKVRACFGKKIATKENKRRIFRALYEACMNTNNKLCMKSVTYEKFKPEVEWLLSQKVPVTILMK